MLAMNDSEQKSAFAERLHLHRNRLGLSQGELADRVGCAQDTISKWERGKTSASVPQLLALCTLFGVSCDYLVGRSDHESGLRPGMFLVDMDAADEPRELDDLAVQIPQRPAVMSFADVQQLYSDCVKRLKGKKRH